VRADDSVDGEEAEETTTVENEGAETEPSTVADAEGDKVDDKELKAAPGADAQLMFIKPKNLEFPAGTPVHLLVGFANRGKKDFIIDSIDAAFRYPQDYSYYIQNFTAATFNTLIEADHERTFQYAFTPSDQFPARPFGLTINLNYHDNEGNLFLNAVFNDTVNIVEFDEGLDGEIFFLYLMLAALVVLLLVGLQQLLVSFSKKRLSLPKKRPVVETGTQNQADIDYDWIPAEMLNKKKQSPKQSPRQRRAAKRSTGGSGDE